MGESGKPPECLAGHGDMKKRRVRKDLEFRGEHLTIEAEMYVCPICGLEVGTQEQTASIQRKIADAYRQKAGLLTGSQIKSIRRKMGYSQADMAARLGIGLASIKRWETGVIQTRSMDALMRGLVDDPGEMEIKIRGNRELSIPRIKLVIREFEKRLKGKLLSRTDKGLYTAKYVWYADFWSYRETGRSMTGSLYAALAQGPQLDNYRELIEEIKQAEEAEAEPLTPKEIEIIARIAAAFPTRKKVYEATHAEEVWKERPIGGLISYREAERLGQLGG